MGFDAKPSKALHHILVQPHSGLAFIIVVPGVVTAGYSN